MIKTILLEKEKQLHDQGYLTFTNEELSNFSEKDAQKLIDQFHGIAMMQLPDKEVLFFEWLKKTDRPVWNDLWQGEESQYHVSIDLLPYFLPDGNGFPICDLLAEPNYWFTFNHIKPKGKERFGQIEAKISADANLNFEEALLVEVSQGSIDLWHFCYKYKVPVAKAKDLVHEMYLADLLVHLPDREDLIKYWDA